MSVNGSAEETPGTDGSETASVEDDSAPFPESLSILAQPTQRRILYHLFRTDESVTVEELAERVGTTTTAVPPSEADTDRASGRR